MSKRETRDRSDLRTIAKLAVVIVALGAILELVACQAKSGDEKIPEPHKDLVQAMLDYCRVGELPRDKWLEAQRAWGFQNGGNPNVMGMWNRAARDKHPIAIKVVRRAADLAVGPDKCPILDVLDHPERLPPKPTPNQAAPGSPGAPGASPPAPGAEPPAPGAEPPPTEGSAAP